MNDSETKVENAGSTNLALKPYDQKLAKNTAFFTDYTPEEILNEITSSLEEHKIPFKISDKAMKLTFIKTREEQAEEQKDGEQVIREQATIQIELLDAGDGNVCVEFKRKQGSSMIFYDYFALLRQDLEHCNNVSV